jgi:hypothetical protein
MLSFKWKDKYIYVELPVTRKGFKLTPTLLNPYMCMCGFDPLYRWLWFNWIIVKDKKAMDLSLTRRYIV